MKFYIFYLEKKIRCTTLRAHNVEFCFYSKEYKLCFLMPFLSISSKCVLSFYGAMNSFVYIIVHFCTFSFSRKMFNTSLPLATQSSDADGEDCLYLHSFVWRQEYLTDVTYPHLVALTVINVLIVVPTILLNALVIVAVATRHRLQSNSNVLVAWLAGTDLLNGLVNQDIEIALELSRIFSHGPFCNLEKASAVARTGYVVLSVSNLMLICIDRYISIKHPLRYTIIVTKQRIKTGLVIAWTVGLLVTIHELILAIIDSGTDLYFLYMKVIHSILSIPALVAIVVISYTYCYIFSESRRHKKRLQTEQLPEEEAKKLKKENKAANTLTLILATLVITYIPLIVVVLVVVYSEDILEPQIVSVIWSWVMTLSLLGSLCNPIIFFWRVKKLRQAILEILHCRDPQNSPPPIEMMEREHDRRKIQPSTTKAFSSTIARQETGLPSFKNPQADEIVDIEETTV